jgi:hypothetical protein
MENANIKGTAIIPKIAAILSKSFFSSGFNLPILHDHLGLFLIRYVNF